MTLFDFLFAFEVIYSYKCSINIGDLPAYSLWDSASSRAWLTRGPLATFADRSAWNDVGRIRVFGNGAVSIRLAWLLQAFL